ncbi:AAA family ATPase, partial [Candidatus Entotheonella palauensis]|uniref:AAA family ATPase n=1 Tax=Candidatus Entotheonella palauensis TaxID=93172 RepID=UPI002118F94D
MDQALLGRICDDLSFRQLARDEDGKGLVWTGAPTSLGTATETNRPTVVPEVIPAEVSPDASVIASDPVRNAPEAERRQLTVMFCDLVGSTDLSSQLDPEDLREVVRAYQETAAEVIGRYEGHIAQYLGDGLLIYFGFPVAHEDDAQRAIYTGLEIPEAIADLNTRLKSEHGVELAVRIGIHTGPVVVGEMGGGGRHENLALGETPNIAARLEGLAQANTAVLSPVTAQLVQRSFVLEALGPHELKGVADPMMLYSVVSPREAEHDEHERMLGGFESLVGRDEEIGLLLRRWEQSKEGQGQVVLISGEAGLGKSSLVEGLRAHVRQEGYMRLAFRCSPYTENSALHPVINQVQQVLAWQREDSADVRLAKLEQHLSAYQFPSEESVPLLASLLSLPLPEDRYPALTLTPHQQRQQLHDTLVSWMLEEAEKQPLLAVWEDLHWADPSTLDLLEQLIDEVPTVAMMNVLAYRPAFTPPWPNGSQLTPLVLNRLERIHIEAFVQRLAGGKPLPAEVTAHIVTKTDGVPLYVEELTKMLLESELIEEKSESYVLSGPLSEATIPATLQDSLMARLDSLPSVKEVAQLGSVLGREFAYDMLQALTALEELTLQAGLTQLVDHELLYQRGRIPRAKYIFRHALIRDAAYQSLLRRTRQQFHQQVAELLEARFPEIVDTQPELVAHHYTEAGLAEAAIGYWQQAGQRATQGSAYAEAIAHLRQGLALLATLPETPEHLQRELDVQVTLAQSLFTTRGMGHPEVEQAYVRARELCEQIGDTHLLFPVLRGLILYYQLQGQLKIAAQLGQQQLRLAQAQTEPERLMIAHNALGQVLFYQGDLASAQTHHAEALTIYNAQEDRVRTVKLYGFDIGVATHIWLAREMCYLGFPDQALQHSQAALALAQEVAHPYILSFALVFTAEVYQSRREALAAHAQAANAMTLATEHGFTQWSAYGLVFHGRALTMQGQGKQGIAEMRQGIDAAQTQGAHVWQPYFLVLLAEAYRDQGCPGKELVHSQQSCAKPVRVFDEYST